MVEKECLLCKQSFIPENSNQNYCCEEHRKEFRRVNRQPAYSARYASKSPEVFIRRLLHKRRYLKTGISIEYMLSLWNSQNGLCAVSGVPMTYLHGSGSIDTNASIDKIEPCKGYVEGNVQLVCRVVNHMKWTNTIERLKWWCSQILNHKVNINE